MDFLTKLNQRIDDSNSLLCVGLDSSLDRLPESFLTEEFPQFTFNKWLIDQTAEAAAAIKINTAFYESRGAAGWRELEMTQEYLKQNFPEVVTIADAKRGDIGDTNQAYSQAFFDHLAFDAITLHAYTGNEALQPFLNRPDKGCIFLIKTSNPGSGEVQDITLESGQLPQWQWLAQQIAKQWNTNQNCMVVVGATYPEQLKTVRAEIGAMPILVPGVGAQGGELDQVLAAGLTEQRRGLLISVSRAIMLAADPRAAARSYRDQINALR